MKTNQPSKLHRIGCLMTLISLMAISGAYSRTTQAQWVANGNNINNTNSGNVGIGTTSPSFLLDVLGSTNNPFRVRDSSGREYVYTTTRTGTYGTTPIVSLASGRLIVEHDGPDGYNNTIIRHTVNSMIFSPSDHPDYPGAFIVKQVGGIPILFASQFANGNVGIGTSSPIVKLDVLGNVRGGNADTYFGNHPTYGTYYSGFWRQGADYSVLTDGTNSFLNAPVATGNLYFRSQNVNKMVLLGSSGNVGIGTSEPATKLHVVGDITVTGNINAKYQDLAEWVPTAYALPAGTVVTLDPTKSNHVMASSEPYDTRVAGVVSAQPGITLGERGDNKVLVATTGRVRIKVDASRGPIQIGDLLVTSRVEGVAMKSQPVSVGGVKFHRPGTLIGKALEPLEKGSGEILVLLSLQ